MDRKASDTRREARTIKNVCVKAQTREVIYVFRYTYEQQSSKVKMFVMIRVVWEFEVSWSK